MVLPATAEDALSAGAAAVRRWRQALTDEGVMPGLDVAVEVLTVTERARRARRRGRDMLPAFLAMDERERDG